MAYLFLSSLGLLLVVLKVVCDGAIGRSRRIVLDPGIKQGHGLRVVSANLALVLGLVFLGHQPWTVDEMRRQMLQFRAPEPDVIAISIIVLALLDDVEVSEAFTRITANTGH